MAPASFHIEVTMTGDARAKDLDHRVRGELIDSFDEELEMEIDDDRLKKAIEEFSERPEQAGITVRCIFGSCSGFRASW